MLRPINKLAALVTGTGWKHPATPIPEKVMDRALRQGLITVAPESLLANDQFVNFIGARLASCFVLGLRPNHGPQPLARTKLGWMWIIWCPTDLNRATA